MNSLQLKGETRKKKKKLSNSSTNLFTCATKNLKKYSCKECSYTTHVKVHLAKHKHDLEKKELRQTAEKYSCQECHTFHSYSLLIFAKHKYEKCPTGDLIETQPSKEFLCPHYEKCPTEDLIETQPSKEFHCPHCEYVATRKRTFVRHLSFNHLPSDKIKWCKCDQCDFKTKHIGSLKRHREVRHCSPEDKVWLICQFCPFETTVPRNFKRHVNKHTDSGLWHHCDKCPYKAKNRCALKQHTMDMHTDPENIVWFKCDWCDYKGKRKEGLKRHVNRKHSKTQTFEIVDVDRK